MLTTHADRTQAPIRAMLDRMGVTYHAHFVANVIRVTGDRAVVDALAARADVASISPDPWVRSTLLPRGGPKLSPSAPTAIEWNVKKVNAPKVWQEGYGGDGIVVGNIDTGQQWTHPAIKDQYRGWNGTSANHNYNWYDEIDPTTRAPVHENGHGTHTTGTILGEDGTNHIGVAPHATWIACRSMNSGGFGNQDTYLGCMEYMLAPWDLNHQNPDPTKAPVAISNSWFCSITLEGCTQAWLADVVHSLRLAGIVVVVAAGNSGPFCETIGNDGPPAQYDDSFTVGATTITDSLASFSSRGPAHFAGNTYIKPDIVAPGDGVRSSYPPNTYAVLSGTSMATPHITGVVALLYDAHPELIGNVDATEQQLDATAHHRNSSSCSSNGSYPNNLYGYGLVDAKKAVDTPPIGMPAAVT